MGSTNAVVWSSNHILCRTNTADVCGTNADVRSPSAANADAAGGIDCYGDSDASSSKDHHGTAVTDYHGADYGDADGGAASDIYDPTGTGSTGSSYGDNPDTGASYHNEASNRNQAEASSTPNNGHRQ